MPHALTPNVLGLSLENVSLLRRNKVPLVLAKANAAETCSEPDEAVR